MFIGHFAVALGAKRVAPHVSLGTLFFACQLADLVWPVLVLTGVESVAVRPGITVVTPLDFISYPFSHSLVALLLWAAALGGGYAFVRRGRMREGAVLAALVLSHWILDFVSHRPDMPLGFGAGARVGLGLWNSLPATLALEGLMFAAGVAVYARSTRSTDRTGTVAFVALIGFLVVTYVAALFGPPPPSPVAVAASALGVWLIVAWGYWVDRHRPVDGKVLPAAALRQSQAGQPRGQSA